MWQTGQWRTGRSSVFGAALVPMLAAAAHAQTLSTSLVATLSDPRTPYNMWTGIAQPPGNTRDLCLARQWGDVRLVRDGTLQAAPVIDLGTSVAQAGNESGLLGIAFHPAFASNGFVFLSYSGWLLGSTTQSPGVHIVRFTLNPADPSAVIPGSALHIFSYARNPGPSSGHFGGWIGFGPDGFLYLSAGDGNTLGPQQLTSDLGKVLRIDPDHDDFPSDPTANYAIPPTNPFFGSTSALPEIWALGLRNPWRCSFDRLTGDLWIADVGQDVQEEIDLQPPLGSPPYAARNYGWPCLEGTYCWGFGGCACGDPLLTPPLYEYTHLSGGAVTGGYVYRGVAIPSFRGSYLFADINGPFWSFRNTPAGISEFTDRTAELGRLGPTTFGEDSSGELYFGTVNAHVYTVYKIIPACPANCDGSTFEPRLNVNDFVCFVNTYAASDAYANCDHSTTPPILNVADFQCFMSSFAAGCP